MKKGSTGQAAHTCMHWGGLGFDVGYVLTGTASIADPTEMQLLEAFRAASPDVKAAALRVLRDA